MAEQACNVIKQGGSSVTIYDLGTGNVFNVSNIKGYQNFTVNNFMYYVTSSGGGNVVHTDSPHGAGSGLSVNRLYDNTTGKYTVAIAPTIWWDTDGAVHNLTGASCQFRVFLVTDTSKIKSNS